MEHPQPPSLSVWIVLGVLGNGLRKLGHSPCVKSKASRTLRSVKLRTLNGEKCFGLLSARSRSRPRQSPQELTPSKKAMTGVPPWLGGEAQKNSVPTMS